MPSRVNGIGTWYWGKNNIITRNAKCEFCGSAGQLISYDTTLYFTVLFLPVIPLQRKRVLNECPRCRRHRVIPLKKWDEQKTAALVEALNAWQADRGNADKARKAVNVTVGYQDRHAFEDLSTPIAQAFTRDADMQMFLASAHDHFDQPESAENAYRSAVAVRKDPVTRRAYAGFLMRQLRPDDAKPLLQDILAARDRAGAPLLLLQAQAYQAVGNHVAAAALLDETGTAFPDLLSNADFQRISTISTKYRGTSKSITAANLDPAKRGGAKSASWFHRNGAKAVVSTIIAIAAAWYIIAAAVASNHKVFIANGTSVSYKVLLNGSEHSVPAKSELPLDLEEGHYSITVPDHPEIEPASFDIKTNFWKRPFDHRTFIINPDRAALIYDRDVQYSAHPSGSEPPPKHPSAFYVGNVLYNIKEPDDAFTEPPSTVDLSSDTSTVTRRHVSQLTKLSLEQDFELVQHHGGAPAAIDWMKRIAATSDDGTQTVQLLGVLTTQLSPAEMIAFLRPRLADRPVRIDWHRMYQSLMEREHPEVDLKAEYAAMLAKNPSDSTLLYLTGRASLNRDEMISLFNRAAYAPKPSAYALYALAYDDLGQTRFAEALPKIQQALRMNPKNIMFIAAQGEIWEAVGQPNSAVEFARSQETHDGQDSNYVADQVRLLAATGNRTAAQQRINGYCAELNTLHWDPPDIDVARNNLLADYNYVIGDVAEFKKATKDIKSTDVRFQVALIDKDYDAAEKMLGEEKNVSHEPYLMLSAVAGATGNKAASDRAWAKAKELMAKGDREERALAAKLASNTPLSPDTILRDCTGYSIERAAFLACMGQRNPNQRDAYFALAKKLNFSSRFPHRELAAAMEAK